LTATSICCSDSVGLVIATVRAFLSGDGWIVLRVWECRLGAAAVKRIANAISARKSLGTL